jgi:response regulator NasT
VAIRRWRAQQALALKLAERQAIDRAKQALMRRQGMTEPEAYRRLRRLVMDSGRKQVEVLGEQ